MAKVHITLVGGQPAPVYNGIIATQPDKVVFIYSDSSRDNAERISTEIQIPSERRKIDPVELNDIEKKVLQCAETYKNDDVSINISSGTKPWAFYFAKVFGQMSNAKIFYVDQNNLLWDFSNKSSHKVKFDMDAQFRLLGNPLNDYTSFDKIEPDDKQAVESIIELFSLSSRSNNMFRLVEEARRNSHLTEFTLKNGSTMKWIKESKQFEITLIERGNTITKTLKSKHVRDLLLKTAWFEYKVAEIISKWDKAESIRMNCKFPYKDSAAKNEIDVLVEAGSKLLFVECKTQIEDNTDIDKFASAVRNYGGMSSKALFVTNSIMSEKAKEKCGDNGILTFSLQDCNLEISNEKALSMLLDSELFNINTK